MGSSSWVDTEFNPLEEDDWTSLNNTKQPFSYSSIVKNLNQVENTKKYQEQKDKETSNKKIKEKKKEKKKNRDKCYTCKPRGKVLKHIITGTGCEDVVFHFDLHKRPIILITPKKHYETLYEIPNDEVINLFKSIQTFCDFWKIRDYQISYNNGSWQNHCHFHIKIKTSEKIINRMRRDHFKHLALERNYSDK